jgi:Uma2 family endonuclease
MVGHALPTTRNAEHIMRMSAHGTIPRVWTEEEFLAARDEAPASERWEFIDGEVLVTPGPHWSHQGGAVRLTVLFDPYVRRHGLGRVLTAPMDVRFRPGLILQPDMLVVPAGVLTKTADIIDRLHLAIEILSPSSARHDRLRKRPIYQQSQVPQLWILDQRAELVERWRPNEERPEILTDRIEWHPEGASEPLVIDLLELFAEINPRE